MNLDLSSTAIITLSTLPKIIACLIVLVAVDIPNALCLFYLLFNKVTLYDLQYRNFGNFAGDVP